MELIDKKATCENLAYKALEEQLQDECAEETTKECLHIVRTMPTIDPVHAAGGCYCRECEFWHRADEIMPDGSLADYGVCFRLMDTEREVELETAETNFCSYGRRREDNDEANFI